jgi:hypothetical protein
MSDYYNEGWYGYLAYQSNPYPKMSYAYMEWARGWIAAHDYYKGQR